MGVWIAIGVLAVLVGGLAWRVFRLEQTARARAALVAAAAKDAVFQRLVARIDQGPATPGREALRARLAGRLKAKAG